MLEALTIVICRVPPPDFNNEFAKLVHPMISDLESAVANVRSNNTTVSNTKSHVIMLVLPPLLAVIVAFVGLVPPSSYR